MISNPDRRVVWLLAAAWFLPACLESNPQPFPGTGKDTGGSGQYPTGETADFAKDVPLSVDIGQDALSPPSPDVTAAEDGADATDEGIAADTVGDIAPPDAVTGGTLTIGPDGNEPFNPSAETSTDVTVNAFGDLELTGDQDAEDSLWLPASQEGTVTRLSLAGWKTVGRYHGCKGESIGGVDLAGNFWQCCLPTGVVNAYAGGLNACKDKDKDGLIETSYDANGDGQIFGNEMLAAGQDECVIAQLGGGLADCHGLATDPEGRVWVTGHSGTASLRRLAADGSGVDVTLETPYPGTALVFAPEGVAWIAVAEPPGLLRVDLGGNATFFPMTDPGLVPTDVSLDAAGRVWFAAGDGAGGGALGRFDTTTEEYLHVPLGSEPKAVLGMAGGPVVASLPAEDALVGLDPDNPEATATSDLPGCGPWGLFPGAGNILFVFCPGSSSLLTVGMPEGTVFSTATVDPKPEAVGNHLGHYSWSWFSPQGTYRHVLSAPGEVPVQWTALSVEGQVVGEGACQVTARVRFANDEEALAAAAWSDPGPVLLPPPGTWDLSGIAAASLLLEVELTLSSPASTCTPVLHLVSVGWAE